jgi:hypothetical protein
VIPLKKRLKKVNKRIEKVRKEYLWAIIGILLIGHIGWISWLLITEFYLIPRATINQTQYEEYEKETVAENKFAPSYSFYDNWGNLKGRLVLPIYNTELRASLVKGLNNRYDINIVRIEADKELALNTISDIPAKRINKISWSDIFQIVDSNTFVVVEENNGYLNTLTVFDRFFREIKSYQLNEFLEIKSLVSDGKYLYFLAEDQDKYEDGMRIEVVRLNLEDGSTKVIYSEKTTVKSHSDTVSDMKLTGVFHDKYVILEKVFHYGNTFNYSSKAIDLETGKADIFNAETIKGNY